MTETHMIFNKDLLRCDAFVIKEKKGEEKIRLVYLINNIIYIYI